MKKGGCWIFLSHSSQDIQKVRHIRNVFESHGQNPLAFHLRCLSTDTEEGRKELDSLIKREIDAREWFVFCESQAASKSQYVKMEKDYILHTGKKKIWSIDMSLSIDEITKIVAQICKDINVYISYRPRERDWAVRLSDALAERDYDVWTPDDLQIGSDFHTQISESIKNTATGGFFVALITEGYMDSYCGRFELPHAIKNNAKIIALILDDCEIPEILKNYHCYRIPNIPTETDVMLIVDLIEADLKRVIRGPISYQADAWNALAKIQEKLNYEKRYHLQEAIMVGNMGACGDYCEIYEFPCCGKRIIVGDGPVSRYRCDGCCKSE